MPIIYTIGHSNRTLSDFVEILNQYNIKLIADVRTVPRSRHVPQFNRESLSSSLPAAGIEYRHFPGLGGLRHPAPDSLNLGWRNLSFRGYADYMQSDDFKKSLEELEHAAEGRTTAIMCAEAVPWRCHRSLIGDALLIRGYSVIDIISMTSARPHKLTPWAKVEGLTITYPAQALINPADVESG